MYLTPFFLHAAPCIISKNSLGMGVKMKICKKFFSVLLFLLTTTGAAHDGPHDDYPVPAYAWQQQDGNAVVTINQSKQSLMISLQAPYQIFGQAVVVAEKELKKTKKELAKTLDQFSKVVSIESSADCKAGFKNVGLQHKHRLLVDRPTEKVKGKDKDKFIKPFTEVLANFKVVCPKKVTISGFAIELFNQASQLKELRLEYRSKNLEQTQNFYPHFLKLK